MTHLNIGIDKHELDRFKILAVRFKARDQAELIHVLNGIAEDVLDGKYVRVQKRSAEIRADKNQPLVPRGKKDSFSEAIAEEKTRIQETPLQTG